MKFSYSSPRARERRSAQIARIGEQLLAVRAGVEAHRQHAIGVDPPGDRVDGELADRDVDPADPPVADAQDRLAVGGDDQVDVVRAQPGALERGIDPVDRRSTFRWTPRGRRNCWLNSSIAVPTVGV